MQSLHGRVLKLAVVGSTEVEPRREIIELLERIFLEKNPNVFISGGARGIDTISEGVFKRMYPEREPVIFRPKQFKWNGLGGFKWRNMQMVHACDELVCIRHIVSETYGSGWTADRVEELFKPVTRYLVLKDYTIIVVDRYRKW